MRICITGTPGTGKSTIAEKLGKSLKLKVLNEKDFCLAEKIGRKSVNEKSGEFEVPIEKLEERLNKYLSEEKNVIIEGHMLCEIKGKFDLIVLLRAKPEEIEKRLEKRGYKEEKVQDNVFCERIEYCKKHCKENYDKAKILEIEDTKTIKETIDVIINTIK